MKLASGIVTFADSLGLIRTLETLDDGIDQNIVVHAQYPGFHPPRASRSLDDTQKVCEAFPNTTLVNLNIASELEARQTYLDLATNYDFLLVIDSDEYIVKKEPKDRGLFRENCQKVIDEHEGFYIYDIMFGGGDLFLSGPKPRLFRQPSKIKYYKKHFWWLLPNGRLMKGNSDSVKVMEGLEIMHDNQLREPNREWAKLHYQEWLTGHESQFVV